MSIDHRLVRRAYTLVEAGIPLDAAVEDLITVAHGSSESLEAAYTRARGLVLEDGAGLDEVLEIAGFDAGLGLLAEQRHEEISELLERAVRSAS